MTRWVYCFASIFIVCLAIWIVGLIVIFSESRLVNYKTITSCLSKQGNYGFSTVENTWPTEVYIIPNKNIYSKNFVDMWILDSKDSAKRYLAFVRNKIFDGWLNLPIGQHDQIVYILNNPNRKLLKLMWRCT